METIFFLAGLVVAQAAGIGVSADSARILAMAEGYWSAVADSASTGGVRKGGLYRLRRIEIRDDKGAPLEGFPIGDFVGASASRNMLEALQGEMRRTLLNQGFPFALIDCELAADTLGLEAVDVFLRVHRGDAYKLGGVRAPGVRIRPETLRRLGLWESGETFSQERVDLGLRRLRRLEYFESVEPAGMYRDSARNLLYPALRLIEARANRLGGLLGYDSKAASENRLTGFLDIHLVNLFGTARDFDFAFENRPASEREMRLAYVEPWIFGLPVGLRLELDFLQQDTAFWEWNRRAVFFQDLGFTSRLEIQLGSQENRDAVLGEHSQALQSGLRLVFDDRDRVPFTRSGSRSEGGILAVRRETGDSSYYVAQAHGELGAWIPLSPRFGLKLGARGATNIPLADRTNRGEEYYVGGTRSLRGYRERQFPTNAYAIGETELQLAMGRGGRLFAFAVPGLINRLVGEYHWRPVFGYGAGIELSKGEWSVAISYALNPERAPGDGLLHAGVDNRF